MARAFVGAFVILALAASTSPHAQDRPGLTGTATQPAATGMIVGQVIDAATGRGVPGAVVMVSGGSTGGSNIRSGGVPPAFGSSDHDAGPRQVRATGDGQFVVRGLGPGRYSVTAHKGGYVDGAYGRRIPEGDARALVLAEGERTGNVDITLWKHAAIAGTVTDEAGEPVVGIEVRAVRRAFFGGRRQFVEAGADRTDDRGEYRVSRLVPGNYVLTIVSTQVAVPLAILEALREALASQSPTRTAAMRSVSEAGSSTSLPGSPSAVQDGDMVRTVGPGHVPPPPGADGTIFVYPSMFLPAAGPSSDASLIAVGSGEERPGADFQLTPGPATRVSGRVSGPEGPVAGVVVRLIAAGSEDFSLDSATASTVSAGDGSFTFPSVPAGAYVLHAQKSPVVIPSGAPTTIIQSGTGMAIMSAPPDPPTPVMSDEPTLWARLPLAVDGRPVTGLELPLQAAGRIDGRLVFDGAGAPRGDELTRILVLAESPDARGGRVPPLRVDRYGRFASNALPGAKYLLRAIAPPGWTFDGAIANGQDVSEGPLLDLTTSASAAVEIRFTTRPTTLAGTVRTPSGAPDPDATVLVFPADTRMWNAYGAMGRHFQSVRAGAAGEYSLVGFPPGSYAAIAVPDEMTADWQDPARLDEYARRATRVQLHRGGSHTTDLTTER